MEFLGPAESYFESHDEGTAFTSDGAMETRSERREKGETIVDRIRLGEISVFVALTQELPDVFTAEILPKLDANSTLNLAQVNKAYNDAVWSAEGVRSMQAKMHTLLRLGRTGPLPRCSGRQSSATYPRSGPF